jgi:hypothetical protein
MNKYDACKILGLTGSITPELTKKIYRQACAQYHPDRNRAGLEMMKMVNTAYQFIKDLTDDIMITDTQAQYGEEVSAALNVIISITEFEIEICGAWVWVGGDTKIHKELLKENGFKWASKKKVWYFRPEAERSFSRGKLSLDEIRTKYGSQRMSSQQNKRISR